MHEFLSERMWEPVDKWWVSDLRNLSVRYIAAANSHSEMVLTKRDLSIWYRSDNELASPATLLTRIHIGAIDAISQMVSPVQSSLQVVCVCAYSR